MRSDAIGQALVDSLSTMSPPASKKSLTFAVSRLLVSHDLVSQMRSIRLLDDQRFRCGKSLADL